MKPIDLTGQHFGRLVATKRAGKNAYGNIEWECQCECGVTTIVASGKLRSGHTRSCGCLVKDTVADLGLSSRLKHGHASKRQHTKAYSTWHGMMSRCDNPSHAAFKYYGGRGITVCKRWREFENFYADMGDPPEGLTLDRINNDGNYEPGNCRWADQATQLANRRKYQRRAA